MLNVFCITQIQLEKSFLNVEEIFTAPENICLRPCQLLLNKLSMTLWHFVVTEEQKC